ncbi:MAG: FtsX-like permease family protein [Faecalibacterium sp.]|jgi:ABC-type antimicrobial peptide transport system permease subunit|nr:FtsX-like permease family protein [Faecalibacterium sp.]
MKSYLSLIPISAKVHKRQNRMTLLCIVFAVFLVTAVFSMAEMGVRMEAGRLIGKHGSQALQSLFSSIMAQTLFGAAAVLFLLILLAGVLMISSSMNSTVAQRTKFFGMMRCIGMSRQQIIRFVRLEALNWCKTAVPVGVLLGVVATWGLCGALRFLVGEEFADMPLFGVSIIGIVSGILLGVVTVLLAARSPAKRAAKVSPVMAVSGNSDTAKHTSHVSNANFPRIETALGIHHAVSGKKNLLLMTSSFALSIILFLSFSVMIDLVNYIMPQSASTADIEIASGDGTDSIDPALLEQLRGMDGVKRVFGRKSSLGVSAQVSAKASTIDVISYDDFDLDCLAKDRLLKRGSDLARVYGNSQAVLAVWDPETPVAIGDQIEIDGKAVEIAGLLKFNPFSADGSTNGTITLITSAEAFSRLTGLSEYSLVMVQTTKNATDEDVEAIQSIVGDSYIFHDQRDQRTTSTYIAFLLFVYGFLVIITAVTVLNIMNSISMSVSAKIRQYGAMRAVGMDTHQMTKMIAAEAATYALSGCAAGCTGGLLLSKLLYDNLITTHYSYAVWSFPLVPLTVILLVALIAAIAAVYAPAKRIRDMAITDTINEL